MEFTVSSLKKDYNNLPNNVIIVLATIVIVEKA